MEQLIQIVEEKWKQITLLLLGVILVLILQLFGRPKLTEKEITPEDFYEELLVEETNAEKIRSELETEPPEVLSEIVVDVKGAVIRPGVYKMEADHRIIDAIQIAGGLLETAEEKGVNFAQKLEDQMVIYIPEQGEEVAVFPSVISIPNEETESNDQQIDINTADKDALMLLNGIGSSKADSIIRYREEQGFFKTIEEIKNVSGIGEATFNNLKDRIKVSSK